MGLRDALTFIGVELAALAEESPNSAIIPSATVSIFER